MADEQRKPGPPPPGGHRETPTNDGTNNRPRPIFNSKFQWPEEITEDDLREASRPVEPEGDVLDLGDNLMGKVRLTEDVDETMRDAEAQRLPGQVGSIEDLPNPQFEFVLKEEAPKMPPLQTPAPIAAAHHEPIKESTHKNPLHGSSHQGPLREPTNKGPLREPTNKSPLREPTNKGPMREPTNKGPMREPTHKNPLAAGAGSGQPPQVQPTFEPEPEPEPSGASEFIELPNRITPNHVELWVKKGKIDLLLRAYPLIEHFSVRNRAITLLGEYAAKHYIDPLIILASIESDGVAQRQILKLFAQLDKEKISPHLNILGMKTDQQKNVLIVIGQLKIEKLLPQIEQCLNLPDPSVRALALSALSQYPNPGEERINLFAEKLHADSSLKVNLAAAQALSFIGTKEARSAFENAVTGREIDPKIVEVLQTMRHKVSFKDTRSAVKAVPTQSYAESGGFNLNIDIGQLVKLLIVLVAFICAVAWAWKKYRYYNPSVNFIQTYSVPDTDNESVQQPQRTD